MRTKAHSSSQQIESKRKDEKLSRTAWCGRFVGGWQWLTQVLVWLHPSRCSNGCRIAIKIKAQSYVRLNGNIWYQLCLSRRRRHCRRRRHHPHPSGKHTHTHTQKIIQPATQHTQSHSFTEDALGVLAATSINYVIKTKRTKHNIHCNQCVSE